MPGAVALIASTTQMTHSPLISMNLGRICSKLVIACGSERLVATGTRAKCPVKQHGKVKHERKRDCSMRSYSMKNYGNILHR